MDLKDTYIDTLKEEMDRKNDSNPLLQYWKQYEQIRSHPQLVQKNHTEAIS